MITSTATTAEPDERGHVPSADTAGALIRLAIGALGVVYGDIGTSPLYAVKECFSGEHHVSATDPQNVLGILSLIFWSLSLVIVVKYLSYIMRADNHGEGGILALLALVSPKGPERSRGKTTLIMLGLFGTALLYGDGVITPAISVLSAVEGLGVATHTFDPYVVPITVVILVGLFLVQRRGTGDIGAVFGIATLLWFITIAAMGLPWIIRQPHVLEAINPYHAVWFFVRHGGHGFLVLGAVVLCITGGEALYADMGHFGKRPIRVAWYFVVFPALLLNYFGQGALLLARGQAAAHNPFYELVTGWLRYPVVLIATIATVVASQALISGAFSLTQQASQLGYVPRVHIVHTSHEAAGQIYIPQVNWALMLACIALVLAFKSSTGLAAAYGIAVTGTMGITSILFYSVARERWQWPVWHAALVVGVFLVIDLSFFAANVFKIRQGGWFPLLVGAGLFALMTTWKRGRLELYKVIKSQAVPLETFLQSIEIEKPYRVKGTAVFMTQDLSGTPVVLLHHFKHNKVLHEQVILLSVVTDRVPEVPPAKRVEITDRGHGFYTVVAHYGFMQTPHVPEILRCCQAAGLKIDEADTSFYLGRETLLTTGTSGMMGWRKALFAFMSRNARPATAYFGIPPNRVVELGTQIAL